MVHDPGGEEGEMSYGKGLALRSWAFARRTSDYPEEEEESIETSCDSG